MNREQGSTRDFGPEVLVLPDPEATIEQISGMLKRSLREWRRKGGVVGLSGGVDSSVVGALAAHAIGSKNVFGVMMPENESADDTLELSMLAGKSAGIETALEDITPILAGAKAYARRDAALQRVIPGYGPGWRAKLVLPSVIESERYRVFSVVAESPTGEVVTRRLPLNEYLQVVAATNFKQRVRKMLEYYHADRLNYAVLGTPNRLEYDQGFFVKNGDGSADVKPIAHLYKSQVYQIAETLGVPSEIRSRPPSTDTYSLPQTQEEFYFSLPYDQMDLCLYALDHKIEASVVASVLGLSAEQVKRVYDDISAKRRMSKYLHAAPKVVVEPTD